MVEEQHFCFFQNLQCEYFPCHKGIECESFNCLFCYCPLYALGKACGGSCRTAENGVKDCTDCVFPHRRENYEKVIARMHEIAQLARRMDDPDDALHP